MCDVFGKLGMKMKRVLGGMLQQLLMMEIEGKKRW